MTKAVVALILVGIGFILAVCMMFVRRKTKVMMTFSLLAGGCMATAGIITDDNVLKSLGAINIILDLRFISRLPNKQEIG